MRYIKKMTTSILWFSFLFFCLVILLSSYLSGCSKKQLTPLNETDFIERMENQPFTITDTAEQFLPGQVQCSYLCEGEDFSFEFYILPSLEQTRQAFENNKGRFEEWEDDSVDLNLKSALSKDKEGANWQYYSRLTSDGFCFVCRIENTMIYAVLDVSCRPAFSELMKSLGYYL